MKRRHGSVSAVISSQDRRIVEAFDLVAELDAPPLFGAA